MKKNNVIIFMISVILWLDLKNSYADPLDLAPKACPTIENIIQSLDTSSISAASYWIFFTEPGVFNIKKTSTFKTEYNWDFLMDNIQATNAADALVQAKNRLLASPPHILTTYDSNLVSSDCSVSHQNYNLSWQCHPSRSGSTCSDNTLK